MARALPSEANSSQLPRPKGIVSVKIDPDTGLRTHPSDPEGIFEIFREEHVPSSSILDQDIEEADISQQVF